MRVSRIVEVKTCISDPWRLRVIAYLDEKPDLAELAVYLEGRWAQKLGVVMVKSGHREVSFFADGKVSVREVNDIEEAEHLVNHLLNLSNHKKMIFEEASGT